MICNRDVDQRRFGAEVTADVDNVNFNFLLRNGEILRRLLSQSPWPLIRRPYFDTSIAMHLYSACARLDIAVVRQGRTESVFENARRFLKGAFGIAVLPEHKRLEVVRRHTLGQFWRVFIFTSIFMDERRGGLERFERVIHIGQLLGLDIDQSDRSEE